MSYYTLVLQAAGRGERKASEELLPLPYEELPRLAAVWLARESAGHTLQPTALVHEEWLQLVEDGERTWKNRAHFFGAAANAMRRILIDNARRKPALKRGADRDRGGLAIPRRNPSASNPGPGGKIKRQVQRGTELA